MESKRPLILVTNDDGVFSPGIRFLAETVKQFGDIVVVGPEEPMSGMSHAITIKTPLRFKLVSNGGYPVYTVNGTPVDCVKLAKHKILDRTPDLLVSGINHGSNASINIIYSGTMAAAFEGAMAHIPSVGFSMIDYQMDVDLSGTKKYIEEICSKILKEGLQDGVCLNVNFPSPDKGEYKGMKVCRQSRAYWKEEFEERQDPHKQSYFWMKGQFIDEDSAPDTDEYALKNQYVSVVPSQFDFTAYKAMDELKNWKIYD